MRKSSVRVRPGLQIDVKMKVGQTVEFYLFGGKEKGTLSQKNEDQTWNIQMGDVTYPGVKTFKILPKKKSDIPPWYILK